MMSTLVKAVVAALGLLALPHSSLAQTFDPLEATIDSIHAALFSGQTTCRFIVESYIARIQAINPIVNAMLYMNTNALSVADSMDQQLAAKNATGALFCIPMVLKDNYDTFDMPTTGGVLALAGAQPSQDAPTTAALRAAGAVLLGKANLHELALGGLTCSSLGGQTHNPYDLTRTPGGSSGGTGAAVSTSMACCGTGTDTVNSLRSPASANSLASIRSTEGLVSRSGIIPISWWQDVAGPIARTVKDVATVLSVMASVGYDPADNRTAYGLGHRQANYTSFITGTALQRGPRIGVLDILFSNATDAETQAVNSVMNAAIAKMQAAGATIVHIPNPVFNVTAIAAAYDVQRYEFRQLFDAYIGRSTEHANFTSLWPMVATGQWWLEPDEQNWWNTSNALSTWNPQYEGNAGGAVLNITLELQRIFAEFNLTAAIYPEQTHLVVPIGSPTQSGRNGELAAITGYPVVCVQAGFSPNSTVAPLGVPIGMEILGLQWSEPTLLDLADSIETLLAARKTPQIAQIQVNATQLTSVPAVTPNKTLPTGYHLGPAVTFT
jgi:Asp-tRNA(Asn)/Glu-tRNA(Gln) amidotransferase A subunit family amidase